jgi:hypothetical protein
MKGIVLLGKIRGDEKGAVFGISPNEYISLILLAGSSGSGKSVTQNHIYRQILQYNTPDELGFVFMDMTQVDFSNWPDTRYLYRPVVKTAKEGLDAFEELGQESIRRAEGKSSASRGIVIHIEECNMVVQDKKRFEEALLNITKHKGKNNMLVVFSTSRPSPDVFTKEMLDVADVKIVHQLDSKKDYLYVAGEDLSEKLVIHGEKAVLHKSKTTILERFPAPYVQALQRWADGDGPMPGKEWIEDIDEEELEPLPPLEERPGARLWMFGVGLMFLYAGGTLLAFTVLDRLGSFTDRAVFLFLFGAILALAGAGAVMEALFPSPAEAEQPKKSEPEFSADSFEHIKQMSPPKTSVHHHRSPTMYLLSSLLALIAGAITLVVTSLRPEGFLAAVLIGTFVMMPYGYWEARRMRRSLGTLFESRGVTIGKYVVLAVVLAFVMYFAGIAFLPDLFAASL